MPEEKKKQLASDELKEQELKEVDGGAAAGRLEIERPDRALSKPSSDIGSLSGEV